MAVITMREALNQAMREEMHRDEGVFLMGEEVAAYQGAYKVSKGLLEEFGDRRVVDSPITELGFAGLGVGAAMVGLRPIIEFMTFNFSILATDQIINSAAKMRYMSGGKLHVPLVMRAPVGATHRGAQHGQCPESYFTHVPGLKVVCVSDAYSAKGILKSAVRDDNPVLIFEHKLLYGSKGRQQAGGLDLTAPVPQEEYLLPLDKAVLKRMGDHVTVVATHLSLYRTLAAAEELAREGIECEVIDPVSLFPLDRETLWASVRKTGRLVIVHEDTLSGGWGAEVAARAADECLYSLEAPIKRVATYDTPLPFAPIMEAAVTPSVERIVSVARSICA